MSNDSKNKKVDPAPPGESRPGAINTWTGRAFYPATAEGEIVIEDVAHALSNQCRYAGHCSFYSVAEHSVLLSACFTGDAAKYALLHDASEAYLVDIPRPLKRLPEFKPYLAIEAKLQARIYETFGLDAGKVPAEILALDTSCIAVEARVMIPRRFPEWVLGPQVGMQKPKGLAPSWAEATFLARYRGLFLGGSK